MGYNNKNFACKLTLMVQCIYQSALYYKSYCIYISIALIDSDTRKIKSRPIELRKDTKIAI